MVKYFWILLLSITACSSGKQILELNSVDDSLRTDGYYIESSINNYNYPYFIYGNGIFKTHGATKMSEDSLIQYYLTEASIKQNHRYQSNFGIVEIENDSIKIQLWPSGLRTPSTVKFGEVKNKTQFVINKLCQLNPFGKLTNCESRNEIYNFVEFGNKPDSTNPFIKPK
jgi:hypothetical protein